jgi:hypothetical protein
MNRELEIKYLRAENEYLRSQLAKPKKQRRVLTDEEKAKNKEKYAKAKARKIRMEEERKIRREERMREAYERSFSGKCERIVECIKNVFRRNEPNAYELMVVAVPIEDK